MANYFLLELDTTAPTLTIQAPSRSIPQNVVEIIITADENLALYQDIYIIDAGGNRRDYIFQRISDIELIGYIDLQEYSIGFATIYTQLKDEVFNESILTSKIINVGYSQPNVYEAHTSMDVRKILLFENQRDMILAETQRNCGLSVQDRNINLNISVREIKCEAGIN